MQLAAREHRLEKIAGVHRAFGLPRTNDGVQLVDEENYLPLRRGDVFENGFQALFELAAILRARDQRAHVERDDPLVLEAFGDVAADDPLRQALDDRSLPDARVADQHRIVFGAAREHLNDAADLFVAADHGIELPALGFERKVAAVSFERLIGAFGVFGRDALVAADLAQGLEQLVLGQTGLAEEPSDCA